MVAGRLGRIHLTRTIQNKKYSKSQNTRAIFLILPLYYITPDNIENFNIYRHIYNMGGKSSPQRKTFLSDVCQLIMSDVRLIGHFFNVKTFPPKL